MTDGEREIMAEAERDARECEESMRDDDRDFWEGRFASPEAELALIQGIVDEMDGNEWTDLAHVGDDDGEIDWPGCDYADERREMPGTT